MLQGSSSDTSSTDAVPQPDEIREALDNLLVQPEFQGSNRIKKFLNFVVERSLEGQTDLLKAPAIAVHVFERDESFDAHANPIVRVEATRLRKVLRAVYDRSDFHEPVEIELPLGSYAPLFRYRRKQQSVAEAGGNSYAASAVRDPTLKSAVLAQIFPRQWSGSAMFALGGLAVLSLFHFYEGVVDRMFARTGVAQVEGSEDLRPLIFVHPFNDRQMTPLEHLWQGKLQRQVTDFLGNFDAVRVRVVRDQTVSGADFHVTSSLESDPVGPLLSFVRHDGYRLSMHQSVLGKPSFPESDLARANVELEKALGGFLSDAYLDLQLRFRRGLPLSEGLSCNMRMREFESIGGEAAQQASFKCLNQAGEGRADSFLAQARLSALWYDHFAVGRRMSDKRDPMQEAFRHAQASMALSPSSAAGMLAYARMLLLTSADDVTALQLARAAYDRNPSDPDARAVLGAALVVLGQYVQGMEHLRAVLEAYPSYPSWLRLYLYVAAVEVGDVEEQARVTAVSDRPEAPLAILARMTFHIMNKNDKAGEEAHSRLVFVEPTIAENPASVFMRLRLRGTKMQAILHRLRTPM